MRALGTVRLANLNDFAEWRERARQLLHAGVQPEAVAWVDPAQPSGLFESGSDFLAAGPLTKPAGSVPSEFLKLAETAICNADPSRLDLLYRVLWRLQRDRDLISVASDPDLVRLRHFAGAVRRESHKMTAFVRFRSFGDEDGLERFAAWFEPEHYVLERTAPFFVRRFAGMHWAIITPYRSAFWNGAELSFGPGGSKTDVPAEDALEESWKTYFASIFNPARLKFSAMKGEMPVRYWRNLPEAELIPSLVRDARAREGAMIARAATEPPVRHQRLVERQTVAAPEESAEIITLADARAAVQGCRRCPLYEMATQAVFGEGPAQADLMFVGEQPGDQEDLAGKPFIGPAGKVFDAAAEAAGIDRTAVYVTNAVKHFKFEPRGKRRIHKKPDRPEIEACRFWLNLERALVKPKVIVALGATAAQSLLGRSVTISGSRGAPIPLEDGSVLFVTVHPSFLLRMPDRDQAEIERQRLTDDLRRVRDFLLERGPDAVSLAG